MLPAAYPRSEALMVLNDLLYDIFYVQLYIVGAEITLLYLPVYIRYIDTTCFTVNGVLIVAGTYSRTCRLIFNTTK